MNTEEEKGPFRLLIVGSGEDLSPRMKVNVSILLEKYPDMEVEYKDTSSPEDWAEGKLRVGLSVRSIVRWTRACSTI